jgi:hypothetical protein
MHPAMGCICRLQHRSSPLEVSTQKEDEFVKIKLALKAYSKSPEAEGSEN